MNYLRMLFFGLLVMMLSNCSKSSGGGGGGDNVVPTKIAPTNLVITPTASTDGTGNVSFTATANNALNYNFAFGDGDTTTVASGILTYKYAASGTYTVTVIAKSASGLTLSQSVPVTANVSLTLAWSDEFNTPGAPDTTKWGYDIGTGSNGWGNNELETYTNRTANAVVANGALNIIAKKESYNGASYTSARLLSYGKFSYEYGYMEVRAQLPGGSGPWPGIWMLGNNFFTTGWPQCGEIDVAEETGTNPNTVYGTLHYVGGNPGSTVTVQNTDTAYHLYGLEWSPTEVRILVDNVVYFSFANTGGLPFNQNFFIILNVAMGGTFGGTVDPNFTSASMLIDYVRVYH